MPKTERDLVEDVLDRLTVLEKLAQEAKRAFKSMHCGTHEMAACKLALATIEKAAQAARDLENLWWERNRRVA